MKFPFFYAVQKLFRQKQISDVVGELDQALQQVEFKSMFTPGERIAITVGSRGIDNLSLIINTLVSRLKLIGALPFIVPAMGSHGGATPEGQLEVLESLGISPETVGAPIISDMAVVDLGKTDNGAIVYMDKNAFEADGIVVVNRIKPHTRFKAENESGLMKMIAVGLGKHKGCIEMHNYGLYPTIVKAARVALAKAPIRLGIGIVENAYDRTARIVAIANQNFESTDACLLKKAKSLMPSLPVDDIDLLVVKEMGKNISGTGMDVNILGRVTSPLLNDVDTPRIKRIVALDLTDASHGNALGMGLADIVPRRLANKINFNATYANVVSAGVLDRGKLPVVLESDKDAIEVALKSIERLDYQKARIVIIRSTLELGNLIVSEEIYRDITNLSDVCLSENRFDLAFDADGNLSNKCFLAP
ncbi:lactate racemase domain-containing protein [Candidatus Formimonas warabiya]|uniref:LarA-like N-terminal domain-containing protein n=1 Tax=Formimonas warabiya TaxID=1761012 RepID=A0A3G1KM31_FORW1|nr:lactate racemase domain-containing protein [Candidatus Formimonas warabiya]ATW23481.1 hypothetical protein DCMF_00525 [Candidatus Formimonas warabiya]